MINKIHSETTYNQRRDEVIILGLPAFVEMDHFKDKECTFFKTSPVTKIHTNGDFETKNGFLCKRT